MSILKLKLNENIKDDIDLRESSAYEYGKALNRIERENALDGFKLTAVGPAIYTWLVTMPNGNEYCLVDEDDAYFIGEKPRHFDDYPRIIVEQPFETVQEAQQYMLDNNM